MNLPNSFSGAPEPAPVIALAGPTGSGKTALALALCERAQCEIINADSRQLYADFPVISAQPTREEQSRASHHLYGFLSLEQKYDAMKWAREAALRAREIWSRGRAPVLVGGTGFYFHTLFCGISPMPIIDREIAGPIWEEMKISGPLKAYENLREIDPAYAASIHPHDRQRIGRALEVCLSSGKTFSWWRARPLCGQFATGPLFVLKTTLAEIVPNLKRRIELMLAAGAAEEARSAWQKERDLSLPGWSCIGARECLAMEQGKITPEIAKGNWLRDTRAYAKRQITWFRSRKNAIFIEPGEFVDRALAFLAHSPLIKNYGNVQ